MNQLKIKSIQRAVMKTDEQSERVKQLVKNNCRRNFLEYLDGSFSIEEQAYFINHCVYGRQQEYVKLYNKILQLGQISNALSLLIDNKRFVYYYLLHVWHSFLSNPLIRINLYKKYHEDNYVLKYINKSIKSHLNILIKFGWENLSENEKERFANRCANTSQYINWKLIFGPLLPLYDNKWNDRFQAIFTLWELSHGK